MLLFGSYIQEQVFGLILKILSCLSLSALSISAKLKKQIGALLGEVCGYQSGIILFIESKFAIPCTVWPCLKFKIEKLRLGICELML